MTTRHTIVNTTTAFFLRVGIYYSIFILLSWIFGWAKFITLFSETSTMKFNTALCFILSGLAIIYSRKKMLSNFLMIATLLICGVTLIEYSSDLYFIDNLLISSSFNSQETGPMSIFTALNFISLNLGFLLVYNTKGNLKILSQFFYFLVFVISLLVLISFILNTPMGYKVKMLESLSLETSLIFLIFTSVLFVYSEEEGLALVFMSKYKGSVMFRKMVLPVVFIPVLISLFFLKLFAVYDFSVSEIFVLYTVVLSTVGLGIAILIAFWLNISSRKNKELSVKVDRSEQQLLTYKLAMDKSLMVVEVEKTGEIVYVNELFQKKFGFTNEECKGELLAELIRSDATSRSDDEGISELVEAGNPWEGERLNKSKAGELIWTQNYIVPFFNKENEIEKYLVIKQDINVRKNEELQKSQDYIKKLEDKNKELEQFTYIASHDLQEPLRTVNGLVGLLKSKYIDKFDENGVKSLNYLTQSTLRMKTLINALLDYRRIGKQSNLEEIDLNVAIKELKHDLSLLLSESKAKLIVHDLPTLTVFKTSLLLVFQNLISNSVKFRDKNAIPEIEISARKVKDAWEFTFQDNGIGIKPEHGERIFAIFQRLHLRGEYEGTGIGLAHCQKIVHLHRGKIWLESNDKKGSCFKFTISTLTHLYEK